MLLHDTQPAIVHRDIKSPNVLLTTHGADAMRAAPAAVANVATAHVCLHV